MTHLILGIGIPGSGKTTFLKREAERRGYAYLSPDDIRKELTGDARNQAVNARAWSIARGRLAARLAEEEGVVFDATFAIGDERREFLRYAREKGATVIHGYYFNIPLVVAKTRNRSRSRVVPEHALERMQHLLTQDPPMKEEGFDTLFIVDEYGNAQAT